MSATRKSVKPQVGCYVFPHYHPPVPLVLTVGCWKEWTEGHYLLPDNQHGYGMLKALTHRVTPPRLTNWFCNIQGG